jgi:hypothetical protein
MTSVSTQQATEIATDILTQQNATGQKTIVSLKCIEQLRDAHRLSSTGRNMVDQDEVGELFSATRVIDESALDILRVSIKAAGPSGQCDLIQPGNVVRPQAGWDFANQAGLSDKLRWAGILGVWPLSEKNAREAVLSSAYFMPSMCGFVDGSLIRCIDDYQLDLTSGRRWFEVRALDTDQSEALFGPGQSQTPWKHIWLRIPQGPIAAYSPHN